MAKLCQESAHQRRSQLRHGELSPVGGEESAIGQLLAGIGSHLASWPAAARAGLSSAALLGGNLAAGRNIGLLSRK